MLDAALRLGNHITTSDVDKARKDEEAYRANISIDISKKPEYYYNNIQYDKETNIDSRNEDLN